MVEVEEKFHRCQRKQNARGRNCLADSYNNKKKKEKDDSRLSRESMCEKRRGKISLALFFFQEAQRRREKPIPPLRFPKFTVAKRAGGVWGAWIRFTLTPPPLRTGRSRHTTEAPPSPSAPPATFPPLFEWKAVLSAAGRSFFLPPGSAHSVPSCGGDRQVCHQLDGASRPGETDCWMTPEMNVVICQPW